MPTDRLRWARALLRQRAAPTGGDALPETWRRALRDVEDGAGPADLGPKVMARLPDAAPGRFAAVGEVVLGAWADPALRERLRAQPDAVLAEAGIDLPAGMRAEVVAPSEAVLPTRERLALPLPPPGSPAVSRPAAFARLAATDFCWVWGTPWAARPMPAAGRHAAPAWGVWRWGRPWEAPAARTSVLVLAALVALTLAWARWWPGGDVRLEGAAGGSAGSGVVVVLIGAAALVALALLFRRGS